MSEQIKLFEAAVQRAVRAQEAVDAEIARAHTRARTTDPETSHEAAEAIAPKLRTLQERVLRILRQEGPMTQHALIRLYRARHEPAPESTIRTRCAELVDKGLVVDTGRREKIGARQAIVWSAAP